MSSMNLREAARVRILDFDIETRKVGFFEAGPFSPDGCEPITIAASWVGEKKVHVWLQPEHTLPEMLSRFRDLYMEADMVTGHYCTKFDLPILNGSLFEHRLPLLPERLCVDTKTHLVKLAGLSKSQENLGAMLGLAEQKFHMNDYRWRGAARLDPSGVDLGRRRAVSDVRQHKTMRLALADAGALKPPRVWAP